MACLCGLWFILYYRLICADSCCHKGDNDASLSKVMVVATWAPSSFGVTIHEALMGGHLHTCVYLSELSCPVKRLLIRWDLCPYSAGMAHWLWGQGRLILRLVLHLKVPRDFVRSRRSSLIASQGYKKLHEIMNNQTNFVG